MPSLTDKNIIGLALGTHELEFLGGTEDFIYDLDVSGLAQPGVLSIQSTAPYEAIDAAYKAGKNVYVRLVSNSYLGLNGVLLSLVGIQTYPDSNVYAIGTTSYADTSSLGAANMLQGLLLSLASYGGMFVWSEQDMSNIGKMPLVVKSASETTATLDPDKCYAWLGTPASLSITLNLTTDIHFVHEYMFIFESGSTPTVFSLNNNNLKWDENINASTWTPEANTTYEFHIINGIVHVKGAK